MACLPYFKFFPADWLADVLDLTLAERGAYITFLAWSWKKDMPLPLEEDRRASILGTSATELRKVWPAIEPSWKKGRKGYTNKRLEVERAKAMTKSQSAKAAADAKWAAANASANGGANA